jgi:hypothetical protein
LIATVEAGAGYCQWTLAIEPGSLCLSASELPITESENLDFIDTFDKPMTRKYRQ